MKTIAALLLLLASMAVGSVALAENPNRGPYDLQTMWEHSEQEAAPY